LHTPDFKIVVLDLDHLFQTTETILHA